MFRYRVSGPRSSPDNEFRSMHDMEADVSIVRCEFRLRIFPATRPDLIKTTPRDGGVYSAAIVLSRDSGDGIENSSISYQRLPVKPLWRPGFRRVGRGSTEAPKEGSERQRLAAASEEATSPGFVNKRKNHLLECL